MLFSFVSHALWIERVRYMEQLYKLPLVLEPQPEGGYTITCPLVPDLVTEADTLDEVQPHVADALAALIEIYQDLGRPLPAILKPFVALPGEPICSTITWRIAQPWYAPRTEKERQAKEKLDDFMAEVRRKMEHK